MQRQLSHLKKHKHVIYEFAIILALVIGASIIFALRYQPAFQIPNFYGEDGPVYINNILHKNILLSNFSGFNGYLILGEYFITDIAVIIYKVFGLHFYQLPTIIAAVSCLFFGLTVSLPYILFKKELGKVLAVGTVILGAFVAMPTYDYAVIGTIGNTKFAFLYWALLLIIYRNYHRKEIKKVIAVDLLLLICLLTNTLVFFLLPTILIPNISTAIVSIRRRKFKNLRTLEIASACLLILVATAYLLVVYLKGVPKLPGYLDTPYNWHATIKILYRVTLHTWLYPITSTMRDIITLGLLGIFVVWSLRQRSSRYVVLMGLWSILIATIGFVFNRPGISNYFLVYGPTPDQFFYTQNLIFIFITAWVARRYMINASWKKIGTIGIFLILFLWWSVPYGSSFGRNETIYKHLGTASQNLAKTCKLSSDDITFQIYPTTPWNWKISKDIACN